MVTSDFPSRKELADIRSGGGCTCDEGLSADPALVKQKRNHFLHGGRRRLHICQLTSSQRLTQKTNSLLGEYPNVVPRLASCGRRWEGNAALSGGPCLRIS